MSGNYLREGFDWSEVGKKFWVRKDFYRFYGILGTESELDAAYLQLH